MRRSSPKRAQEDASLAILTLKNASKWPPRRREAVAAWLEHQANVVRQLAPQLDVLYRARYLS